jgi:23S rRNA (pseudouridine1915-N3)-methyltransferase
VKIHLLAIGTKMPAWVETAWKEYASRMPRECELVLKEIPAEKRTKNSDLAKIKIKEADKLWQQVPGNAHIIALDLKGKTWSTEQLATQLENWMMSGRDIALLVGGPEGLTDDIRQQANQLWSLSSLTFPHPMVRVILAEQLFRAWSITANHPYHRAG